MNIINNGIILTSILALISCGSSQQIITNKGEVYDVKGKTINKSGTNITKSLDASEKNKIYDLVDSQLEEKKEAQDKIKNLEKDIESQEQIKKEAIAKKEVLKKELEVFNDQLEAKAEAKSNYIELKKDYDAEVTKFDRLKNEQNLSESKLKEWNSKLKKLENKVIQAKTQIN